MHAIPCGSATFPCKHSASPPGWLAATPTPHALPKTSAAAAPPATPGGAVATRPIAWGRPPFARHVRPPLDAEAAWMATGNNGGWQRGRRGGSPQPAAPSAATAHSTAARSSACVPARGARPTRPAGTNERHALMTTATSGHSLSSSPSLVTLPRSPPRHAVSAAGSRAGGDDRTRHTSAACGVRGHAAAQCDQPPPADSPEACGGRATSTPTAARAVATAWDSQHCADTRLSGGSGAEQIRSRRGDVWAAKEGVLPPAQASLPTVAAAAAAVATHPRSGQGDNDGGAATATCRHRRPLWVQPRRRRRSVRLPPPPPPSVVMAPRVSTA